ncbi:MAG: hypothetical protein WDZ68_01070, partial [Candidatus Paceibacterota bacterium]
MAKKPNKVVFKGDQIYDQSLRAGSVLDSVLSGKDEEEEIEKEETAKLVPVKAELRAKPIIHTVDSNRARSRVLFVTSDVSVLTKGSARQIEYTEIANYFDEVHIFVLVNRRGKNNTIRVGNKTWIYSVYGPTWWLLPFYARSVTHETLVFSDAFRPDIVVGIDPYEAGLAALLIAKEWNRPVQLHIDEDFTSESFISHNLSNKWRSRMAKYVLKRVKSVRTKTGAVKNLIKQQFKNVIDIELLPKFYNFSAYMKATPAFNIHDKYKDFKFIMLTFAPLTADSHL